MKNQIILCAAALIAACTYSMQVNAQLEVLNSGDVKVSKNATFNKNLKIVKNVAIGDTIIDDHTGLKVIKTTAPDATPYYGIKSIMQMGSSMPTAPIYGIYGEANAGNASNMISGQRIVGVFGFGVKNYNVPSIFSAGVAGLTYYAGGIGVYGGATYTGLPTSMPSGVYAGYFDGTVKVNGTLIATAVSSTSDARYKENIQDIKPNMVDSLALLRPVSYTLKPDSAWIHDKDAKELKGTHYGLIAQEVQKIFPELVYERGDQLSINYIELIPLLILKVQELSKEVEALNAHKK